MSYSHDRSRTLSPTFQGFVFDTADALLLYEAVLRRQLHFIPRRLVPGEYKDLVKSGSIFIYEENESGIRRWTDGRSWSPSRVLDNFLVYRESEKLPPTVEKKNLKRKFSSTLEDTNSSVERDTPGNSEATTRESTQSPASVDLTATKVRSTAQDKELIKSLAGSFTDDNLCRDNGLVKKTLSVVIRGLSYHMVSYYTISDIKKNVLLRPSADPRLSNLSVRPDLYKQNFRQAVYMPIEHAATQASRSPPDVYLHMAPGTHSVQLLQTSPTQPATYGFSNGLRQRPNATYPPQTEPGAHYSTSTKLGEWPMGWSSKTNFNSNMEPSQTSYLWSNPGNFGIPTSSQLLLPRPLLPVPETYQSRGFAVR